MKENSDHPFLALGGSAAATLVLAVAANFASARSLIGFEDSSEACSAALEKAAALPGANCSSDAYRTVAESVHEACEGVAANPEGSAVEKALSEWQNRCSAPPEHLDICAA